MRKLNCEWVELPAGIAFIVLAIYLIAAPDAVFGDLSAVGGPMAIAGGVLYIARYLYFEQRTGLSLLLSLFAGILCIIAGTLILLDFPLGVLAFTILAPIWFIAYCLSYLFRDERLTATDVQQHETFLD